MMLMDQIRAAALAGLLLGIRVLVALGVLLLGAGWVLGDYVQVRRAALS